MSSTPLRLGATDNHLKLLEILQMACSVPFSQQRGRACQGPLADLNAKPTKTGDLEGSAAMSKRELSIGELAEQTGCKVQTIRYYEQIGLMPEPLRTGGNQRRYGAPHLARLAFIRHSRELGFPLESIRELLSLSDAPDQSCSAADEIARRQLKAVEGRIRRLRALQAELKRMVAQCSGGNISSCRVIEVLADASHAHCLTDRHGLVDRGAVGVTG